MFGPGPYVMWNYMNDANRNKSLVAIFDTISIIVAILTAIYCSTETNESVSSSFLLILVNCNLEDLVLHHFLVES